jgi:hypothetical protein
VERLGAARRAAAARGRQGGGGADDGEFGRAVDQEAEDNALTAAAIEEAGGSRHTSPVRSRSGSPSRSPDPRGVRALRANLRRLEGRAAQLEAEAAGLQRRCLALLRFKPAFEGAMLKLERSEAAAAAAREVASAAVARGAEASGRAEAAEARAAALQAERDDLASARLELSQQLEEFGRQLAELRGGSRGQRALAGTSTAGQPGFRESSPGQLTGGKASKPPKSAAASDKGRRSPGLPAAAAAAAAAPAAVVVREGGGGAVCVGGIKAGPASPERGGTALQQLMDEIQRGIDDRQRIEVQREMLLELVAGRPVGRAGSEQL